MTVRLDDLAVVDPVLSLRWDSIGVDRRMVVTADGTAWLWSLADAGQGSDAVGTWRLELDPGASGAVAALARSVTVAAAGEERRLGFTVTAGTVAEWVPEGSDRAGEILAVVGPLLVTLRTAPLAVARWAITVGQAPTGERLAGFSVTAEGSTPVTLLVDATGLTLTSGNGTALPVPPPRMGLVTADVELLDGLYQPAVLAPGRSGTCAVTLPDDAGPGEGGVETAGRRGGVTGAIGVPGPWSSPEPGAAHPTLAFSAGAEVRRLG